MHRQLIILFYFFIGTCGNKNTSISKKMDFVKFNFSAPNNWVYIEERGVDSYVGSIAIDEMDTIYFDYGLYKVQLINETNLSESFIKRGELGELYNKQNIHFKDTFQTENEFYYWSELNKRTVQTILPKVSGKGVIGFYFDSVRLYYNQNLKLTIYGRDLKPENEERLKKVISTIEFCSE